MCSFPMDETKSTLKLSDSGLHHICLTAGTKLEDWIHFRLTVWMFFGSLYFSFFFF